MRKLITIIKVEIASSLEYRADIFIFFLASLSRPLIFLAVWLAALASGAKTPLSSGEFIQYYILVLFVGVWSSAWSSPFTAAKIRYGNLSAFLLRPVHFLYFDLGSNIGEKVVKFSYLIPTLIIISILFQQSFTALTIFEALLILIALVCSFAINFFLEACLGFAAFWLEESRSLSYMVDLVVAIFSGSLFPLVVLPLVVRDIAYFLPFRFMLSLPIEIYLHQLTTFQMVESTIMAVVWATVSFSLAHLLWRTGIKKYSASGA